MVDIAKSEKYGTRGWFWGSLIVSIATVPMGVVAVLLAMCRGGGLGALVALSLSFFWGGVAAGLLALRFSARRIHAEMQVRVIESTIQRFLEELKARDTSERDSKDTSQWAETMDRLDGLASKALENADRRA